MFLNCQSISLSIRILFSLFLAILASQPTLNVASSCSPKRLSVPRFEVGWALVFLYTGNGLSRVTLSIEDSIGKSLDMQLRHNEGCTGNPPQLLLNTETNGRVDTEIVEFPKLRSSLWWTVTAQETGWLIEQLDTRFSRTFNYHPSHQLSDVSTIEIRDEEGCEVDTGFNVLLKFREEVRMVEYSKVRY